jgi:hypothetical protein
MEDVVYVLKYYLHFRQDFASLPTKTLPPKSTLHIEEVIEKGVSAGDIALIKSEIPPKSKVIAHTINGYLLEYYPDRPHEAELTEIANDIVTFALSGLTKSKEII